MTLTLGYSGRSKLAAHLIADASDGEIVAVRRSGGVDINWGRRSAPDAALNPTIENAVNKLRMRQLFVEHGVPSPHLCTPDEAIVALNEGEIEGGILIGRPTFHMKGRGYWVCETATDVERALAGTRRRRAATHFIRFIDLEREFRVHVFQGKSIRISEKKHTEFHKYTTIKPTLRRKRHVRNAAKAAVEALGLDFGAVDILADDDQAYVLEVNSAPGLGGTMPSVWADTFRAWHDLV